MTKLDNSPVESSQNSIEVCDCHIPYLTLCTYFYDFFLGFASQKCVSKDGMARWSGNMNYSNCLPGVIKMLSDQVSVQHYIFN